jgi:hypothetical protein
VRPLDDEVGSSSRDDVYKKHSRDGMEFDEALQYSMNDMTRSLLSFMFAFNVMLIIFSALCCPKQIARDSYCHVF